MIKKLLIRMIRKIIYLILKIFKFSEVKNKNFDKYNSIKCKYDNKKIEVCNNKFEINNNVDLNIIVPIYNSEKLLYRCLNTLLSQKTKYKYKIVCINDGSTDKSLDILNQLASQNNNMIVISQENKGISEARNLGIKNIDSRYIAFVDSDDLVTDNFVETIMDNAYKNNADIVRCNYYEYDVEKQKVIKTGKNLENIVYESGIGKDILKYKGYPWGGVFKTELWKDVQFPNGYWYEDMVIRMVLFRKAERFSYIDDKLYYYCIHSNNISKAIEKTSNLQCLDQFFLIKNLHEFSNIINLKDDKSLYINMLYEYGVILWLRTRKLEVAIRKQIFEKACEIINSINNNYKIENEEKILIKIFKRKDYIAWKLYAIYKMMEVKYGV